MEIQLEPRQSPGSSIRPTHHAGWRLEIPAGPSRTYRLAQLDDYARTPRRFLKHTSPLSLSLRARVSDNHLPGTWGFGLWNDPFGFSLGFGSDHPERLPALPQAAWFMHASPPNWLSLQGKSSPGSDKPIPAQGFFAGTYRSPLLPSLLLVPGLLAIPLCAIRPFSRLFRRLAGRLIHQDAAPVDLDVTQWQEYSFHWQPDACTFIVNGNAILRTTCSPTLPLGLVVWIDNQYAAWTPEGRLGYRTLENPLAWLECEDISIR